MLWHNGSIAMLGPPSGWNRSQLDRPILGSICLLSTVAEREAGRIGKRPPGDRGILYQKVVRQKERGREIP